MYIIIIIFFADGDDHHTAILILQYEESETDHFLCGACSQIILIIRVSTSCIITVLQ